MSARPIHSKLTSGSLRRAVLCAVALAILAGASILPAAPAGCNGQCLNPHPGELRSWYGQENGCRVEVWRQWPDGCMHSQWYNKCTGDWDVDPQGQPQVTWTCCVH